MPDADSPLRSPALGCVSYLNAKPLIDGFAAALPVAELILDVPARLVDLLRSGRVDLALCPVIDYFTSPDPLVVVPVGGIGCAGPTLTVRLFSPVAPGQIRRIYVDAESHTSVCLLRLILSLRYANTPEIMVGLPEGGTRGDPEAARLLIGDKVVTDPPDPAAYPHQIDLGEAWHQLTGRPFVFALWLTRPGADLGPVPDVLAHLLQQNLSDIDAVAHRYAAAHGWPDALARDYLGRILRYPVGREELDAVTHFATLAYRQNLLANPPRALVTHP